MKHLSYQTLGIALMSGLILGTALPAQVDQDELKARRDKKLAADFLQNGDWITDYTKAREAAKKSKKIIFGYFTRSYSP